MGQSPVTNDCSNTGGFPFERVKNTVEKRCCIRYNIKKRGIPFQQDKDRGRRSPVFRRMRYMNRFEWREYTNEHASLAASWLTEDAVRTTGPDEGFDAFCRYREYEFLKNAAGWIPQPVKQFGRRRNMVPKPSEERQHRACARSGRGYRHKNLRPVPPKEKDGKAYRFGV